MFIIKFLTVSYWLDTVLLLRAGSSLKCFTLNVTDLS
jgi:hypothetical protein